MQEVRFTNVPTYQEIAVKNIYDKALLLSGMSELMPVSMPKCRTIDRQYFYNCFNTLYPEEVAALVKQANAKRYTVENEKQVENSIIMTKEQANAGEELPFISKQKGRMSHLLKKKNKLGVERKDRVQYEAYYFLKRPRGSQSQNNMANSTTQPQTQPTGGSGGGQSQSYLGSVYAEQDKKN